MSAPDPYDPWRRKRIVQWLATLDVYALTGKTHRELFDHSYPTWNRNGRAWQRRLPEAGGTYVLRALMWYQHVHRPGSTDSRPGVVIPAILDAIGWGITTSEMNRASRAYESLVHHGIPAPWRLPREARASQT